MVQSILVPTNQPKRIHVLGWQPSSPSIMSLPGRGEGGRNVVTHHGSLLTRGFLLPVTSLRTAICADIPLFRFQALSWQEPVEIPILTMILCEVCSLRMCIYIYIYVYIIYIYIYIYMFVYKSICGHFGSDMRELTHFLLGTIGRWRQGVRPAPACTNRDGCAAVPVFWLVFP